MIVNSIEAELVAISQHLRSFTVEIVNHRSIGSGIIWSTDGLVITNAHVAMGSQVQIKLSQGKVIEGDVIARDRHQDLAAIQVDVQIPADRVSRNIIGNSQNLRPGEMVLAMGSPWGFSETLTTGVIHALQKHQEPNKPTALIIADLRLAPGNSGGVLANVRGEIIGVNVAIYRGLALAIPSQQVEKFIRAIPR